MFNFILVVRPHFICYQNLDCEVRSCFILKIPFLVIINTYSMKVSSAQQEEGANYSKN